jgi:hypothetical protein
MQARSDPSNSLHSDQVQARTFIDARPWNCVDFVSDVHLNPLEALTAQAFWTYLQNTPAQAVFILGDLFEVWIGDDVLSDTQASFERDSNSHFLHAWQQGLFAGPGVLQSLWTAGHARPMRLGTPRPALSFESRG